MKVTSEQIERANLVNLPDFLRSQGFVLKPVGREYILQEHDSLHIKDNKAGEVGKWFRFSENRGGNNIQFVQEFMGLDFISTLHQKLNRPKIVRSHCMKAQIYPEPCTICMMFVDYLSHLLKN